VNDVARLRTPDGDRDDPNVPYTTAQAAEYVKVSVSTLYKLRRDGGGPEPFYQRKRGGRVTYPKFALDTWLAAQAPRTKTQSTRNGCHPTLVAPSTSGENTQSRSLCRGANARSKRSAIAP